MLSVSDIFVTSVSDVNVISVTLEIRIILKLFKKIKQKLTKEMKTASKKTNAEFPCFPSKKPHGKKLEARTADVCQRLVKHMPQLCSLLDQL